MVNYQRCHMKKFLLGVLVGASLMGCVHVGLNLYEDLHTRVSRVEGYIRQLDLMLRSQ